MKIFWIVLVVANWMAGFVFALDREEILRKSGGNNTTQPMDKFVDRLLGQMSLEEKIGQLNLLESGDMTTGEAANTGVASKIRAGQVGGLFGVKGVLRIKEMQRLALEESRLKIPLLIGMDVLHGYQTVFPIPLALSCSWDLEAIERSARIAASEASADGICWTFAPMVDICRDPRWGRIAEGNGEDPFLGGEIAKAMVRGFQGKDLTQNDAILACVKHFALYGASEAGRDYNTVDMSRFRMYNEYLPPYQAAVDAGAGSVMTSFNEIDGVPATGNKWLLTDLLRNQWGFKGLVVTDYTAITEMEAHGIGDLEANAARALEAGIEMDMVSEGFVSTLQESLKKGKIQQAWIDTACRHVLEAKYKLGLFDNPYKYCDLQRAKNDLYTKENRAAARKIAAESFVLLKNEQNLLPLKKQGTIAVFGPLADSRENMLGTWSQAGQPEKTASLVEGLRDAVGKKAQVVYAKGSDFAQTEQAWLDEAVQVAQNADVIVAAIGEFAEMSGESSSRSVIEIPEAQRALLESLVKTRKPVVLVLFTGRPLVLKWESEVVPAILNVWFGGSESAYAIADVLFGDVNPSGKLTTTFPQNLGQVPLFYNHKNTGRPLPEGKWFKKFRSNYLDVSNEPLYPFGFGMSYTTFSYSDITLSSNEISDGEKLVASVKVTNTGTVSGQEIVQLYLRDLIGSVTRPVKELKGFEKISLRPGESRTVAFSITLELLKFYNENLEHVCEPGDFDLMIGGNSRDVKTARFSFRK